METEEALQGQLARRGSTGSCRAAGRASARTGIGERLRRVQRATKDEYRYKPIKTWSQTWIQI